MLAYTNLEDGHAGRASYEGSNIDPGLRYDRPMHLCMHNCKMGSYEKPTIKDLYILL